MNKHQKQKQVIAKTKSHFGQYGGQYVPDTLFPALEELEQAYLHLKRDPSFLKELRYYLSEYVGRPSPLFFAERLSKEIGAKVYLKREDLLHTGAHKINNTIGQVLLAKKMGKTRIIAETGAGQHGVATATVCALMGLKCVVYMGALDIERQALNVYRMRLLGAEIESVDKGSKTLKDATTEAIRDWMTNVGDTHYIIGSVLGPHPYPTLVRDFQSVIGKEALKQIQKKEGRLPNYCIACVGGGSNAMGLFYPFLKFSSVELIAAEAGGIGNQLGQHAAALSKGKPGILHGSKNYVIQTPEGQVAPVHSISAGLDYPGVSPELSHLNDQKRLIAYAISDKDALDACKWVARLEGIIPALETSHAFAALRQHKFKAKDLIILNVSGRGDKDMETIRKSGI